MSPPEAEFIGPKGRSPKKVNLKIPAFGSAFVLLLALCVVAAGVLYNTCFEYIRPNEYGVKEVKIGLNKGIQEKVHTAGLIFKLPVINQIHVLPRDVQVFELSRSDFEPGPGVYITDMANIQTSDGFFVDVDVTILYRITDAYKVVTQLGPGDMYLEQGILPKAEPILKQTLGQLTTEDFYNSPMRVAKQELARDMLDAEMTDKGMAVDHVLIRYFEYSEAIQQNIEDKKLQDQLVFTNISKRKAAEQEQQLMRVREEGEYNVKIALQEGDAYRVEKEAERDLYVRTKEAEADLLIRLAEAESTRLKNEALQTAGSEALVALEMAKILKGLDTIIVPAGGAGGLNPLNLTGILDLFGMDETAMKEMNTPVNHTPSPLLQELREGAEAAAAAVERIELTVPEVPDEEGAESPDSVEAVQ